MLLAAILAACSQQSPSSEAPAKAESEMANQSVETAEKLGTSWGDGSTVFRSFRRFAPCY